MNLTKKQKDLIRKELSGKPRTLLYYIKTDIDQEIWNLDLYEEDIESLRRMWEFFSGTSYCVTDPEIDDIILDFEKEIINVWEVIRHGVCKTSYISDIEFDKEGIKYEIDEAVKKYLETLEEE